MENYPATIDLKKKAKKRNGDLPHKTCALCKKNQTSQQKGNFV